MKFALINIVLLLVLTGASAQPITQLPDLRIFPGNAREYTIPLSRPDSAFTTTAELSRNDLPLVTNLQPIVIRSGRNATISWSPNQTRSLPPQSLLKVKVGNITRFTANVFTTTTADIITPNTSLTVVYPVSEGSGNSSGPSVLPGSTSKKYTLENCPADGNTIVHNGHTKILRATFFRADTGQPDGSWKVQIQTDNSVVVKGIAGETFSGDLWLELNVATNN